MTSFGLTWVNCGATLTRQVGELGITPCGCVAPRNPPRLIEVLIGRHPIFSGTDPGGALA